MSRQQKDYPFDPDLDRIDYVLPDVRQPKHKLTGDEPANRSGARYVNISQNCSERE
jgi:hypothetical protein